MIFRREMQLSALIGQFFMNLTIFEDKIAPKIPEKAKRATNAIEKVGKIQQLGLFLERFQICGLKRGWEIPILLVVE